MIIRIEGRDLPGRTLGVERDFPEGHRNIHVAIQGRKGQQDLLGLCAADASSVFWDLDVDVASAEPFDVRGPQVHGSKGQRFLYITWGDVDGQGTFAMFRRAKLWLDAVPSHVVQEAVVNGVLVGRLGLTDHAGWPLCASVRPPRIEWTATG